MQNNIKNTQKNIKNPLKNPSNPLKNTQKIQKNPSKNTHSQKNFGPDNDTLCLSCDLCTARLAPPDPQNPDTPPKHLCSWAGSLEPVPGWEAVKTDPNAFGTVTYRVISCPLYTPNLWAIVEILSRARIAEILGCTELFVKRYKTLSKTLVYRYLHIAGAQEAFPETQHSDPIIRAHTIRQIAEEYLEEAISDLKAYQEEEADKEDNCSEIYICQTIINGIPKFKRSCVIGPGKYKQYTYRYGTRQAAIDRNRALRAQKSK